jgi:hypothetical protein
MFQQEIKADQPAHDWRPHERPPYVARMGSVLTPCYRLSDAEADQPDDYA